MLIHKSTLKTSIHDAYWHEYNGESLIKRYGMKKEMNLISIHIPPNSNRMEQILLFDGEG
jgi:hypothetical protein